MANGKNTNQLLLWAGAFIAVVGLVAWLSPKAFGRNILGFGPASGVPVAASPEAVERGAIGDYNLAGMAFQDYPDNYFSGAVNMSYTP